ncbi:MAG: hypothetical protein PVF63_06700, partial [Gammaproteobacteria bacterium]
MQQPLDPDLATKVAYLRRPDAYPDAPDSIEAIETHFAWVFLSRKFVYKLKKPVRIAYLDLLSAETRRANCELEIALNRRLAADTYIGVVALGRHGSLLQLESPDDPVDWLVKMYRLPRERALESLLPDIDSNDLHLTGVIDKLSRFYRETSRAPWNPQEYAEALRRQCRLSADRLMLPELAAERARVQTLADAQLAFVAQNSALLARRITAGRICDTHGDLRPEHIFLTQDPQIIDCLEFSAELRQLDTAEEISFLALECELRGRADIARRFRELYCSACADDVPRRLFDYYRSTRALVRAFLSAWHLSETPDKQAFRHWLDQTHWYIRAA